MDASYRRICKFDHLADRRDESQFGRERGSGKESLQWSSVGFLIRFLLPQFLGICALAYFMGIPEARSELLTPDGSIVGSSELTMSAFPHFLGQILPVGIIGIVGAGMLAAFMSTHDSYLLCWASVIVEDVVVPLRGGEMSTRSRLLLARLLLSLIHI